MKRPEKGLPALARWVMERIARSEEKATILGDMEEYFHVLEAERGRVSAVCWFYGQVALSLPSLVHHSIYWSSVMFKNYLKITLRSLARHPLYSAINISGLSFGIACCLLISLYVYDELSYDAFFEESDHIYRIALNREFPDHVRPLAVTPVAIAPTVAQDYQEVVAATRLHRLIWHPEMVVTLKDRAFVETKMFLADERFFEVFSFRFLEGDPQTALDAPNKVVLTDKTARRYFGDAPALGQVLHFDFGRDLVVSAIIEDLPENSHLDFDLLASVEFMQYLKTPIDQVNWTAPFVYTYVKLQGGSDPQVFEAKLPGMVAAYAAEQIQQQLGEGQAYHYFLQPLEDIHLHSHLDVEAKPNGNILYIYLLIAIAVFILLLSCINFINLATARSTERAKEVGIRKVMGSLRSHLIRQFLTESVTISVLSMGVGVFLVLLLLPMFNSLVGKGLEVGALNLPFVGAVLVGFALVVGVLAGGYPALVISSMRASVVLKGAFKTSTRGVWLRNGLVVFQFAVSIVLIAGTLLIGQQVRYMQDKQLGFDKENVVLIKHPLSMGEGLDANSQRRESVAVIAEANRRIESFKSELLAMPEVSAVGGSFAMPGKVVSSTLFQPEDPSRSAFRANIQSMDEDFIPAIGLNVIAGRGFSEAFQDSLSIVINETAARALGWDDPVGRTLRATFSGVASDFEIIGVVEDFHFQSLHTEIFPLVILKGVGPTYFPVALAVRVNPGNVQGTLQKMQATWQAFVPGQEMLYSFLDEDLQALYEAEQASSRIFNVFALLAILLACVGLFGLAAYITQQRTKEIGIRKVLGASIADILLMLSRSFTRLILIAFVVAVPVAYFGMDRWLDSFAYRIEVGGMTFFLAGGLTLLLAWLTISYQSIKSALMNPVNSLRSE